MSKKYLYLAGVALIVGGAVSLLASASPDGLEKVAEDKGFIETALDYPFGTLMPDYVFPAIANEYLATAFAGVIGTVLVFVVVLGVNRVLMQRKHVADK